MSLVCGALDRGGSGRKKPQVLGRDCRGDITPDERVGKRLEDLGGHWGQSRTGKDSPARKSRGGAAVGWVILGLCSAPGARDRVALSGRQGTQYTPLQLCLKDPDAANQGHLCAQQARCPSDALTQQGPCTRSSRGACFLSWAEPGGCARAGRAKMEWSRAAELPSFRHRISLSGVGGAAVLTAEGRGGGRANSQPPAEVLSGGSCVPPDSWHGEGVGSTPTSCAQLSPWPHSASPAVPCPAAGLLNWRFVAAEGNNTTGRGGGYGGKEGKARELGVLQENVGGCAWQDSWKEQKWQASEQIAEKKRVGAREGTAPWAPGQGRGTWGLSPRRPLWMWLSRHLSP